MALYTKYLTDQTNGTGADPLLLEETQKAPLDLELIDTVLKINPKGISDLDGDGYREVSLEDLTLATTTLGLESAAFPLATYFEDRNSPLTFKQRLEQDIERTKDLPRELIAATVRQNYRRARHFFADRFGSQSNLLKSVADVLARHLAATAVHGVAVPDQKQALENENGFSVRSDGRLRFGCQNFVDLAYSDLRAIPELQFQRIALLAPGVDENEPPQNNIKPNINSKIDSSSSEKQTPISQEYNYSSEHEGASERRNHVILLVSHKNHHLIIDNGGVIYFESEHPEQLIQQRYIDSKDFQSYKSQTL